MAKRKPLLKKLAKPGSGVKRRAAGNPFSGLKRPSAKQSEKSRA